MEFGGKSKTEKIVNILLNIFIFIFGIILLISIYSNIQTKILKKSYSDFFGISIFEVQTGSMSDAINPGDWIIVKSSRNFKLNDIVTYKYNDEFVTHRIIEAYSSTYVTKGDANNTKDDPINKDQIVGKVIKVLPNFGIFKKTIFNPVVLLSLILTMLICNFLFKKTKENNIKVLNEKIDVKKAVSNVTQKITTKKRKTVKSVKSVKKQPIKELEIIPDKIEENVVQEIDQNELNEENLQYIPVDISELDDTFLEIAKNEIEEPKNEEIKVEVEPKEEQKKTSTKINLELLDNKAKKSKNVIDKVITIKIEELNEIINIIESENKVQVNEPTIKNLLMSAYIDAKYYNYYGDDIDNTSKKQTIKINKYLQHRSEVIKSDYKGSDTKYNEKVDKFLEVFDLINNLEQAKDSITDTKAKNEYYKKEITKFSKNRKWNNSKIKSTITEIMKVQRNYIGIVDYLFKKLETNMFELNVNKLSSRKNLYGLSLTHNINFSKVYSDYIIDKTYSEGVVAEDKMTIMLTLLSTNIASDMLTGNFNKKYILVVPKSLFSKEKKFEKILKSIDDEYAKDNVILLSTYECLNKYKTLIKKLKQQGFHFSTVLNNNSKIEEKYYKNLYLVDYIFVDKKLSNVVKVLSTLPEDLADKVVYEDITEEVGDFGGE